MDITAAFTAEAEAVEATIATITDGDWDRPALGEWSVAELVAHLVRAADRIAAYADEEVEGEGPVCDRVSYFDFDHAAAAPGVADRSRQDARRVGSDGLPAAFAEAWRSTADLLAAADPARSIQTFRGPMALEEYAATRVLELVVHHLDLCRALGRCPATTPAALSVTEGILVGLLDGDPPETLDTASFVLAATGREAHPDPRLPVIA